jgi:hypothetical protein
MLYVNHINIFGREDMKTAIRRMAAFLMVLFVCLPCLADTPESSHLTFQPVSDSVISLAGMKAARPDTLLLGEKFYVCYLQLSPHRTFRLLVLDNKLTLLGTTNLFSGENQPTDIRICTGPGHSFSYAFETTRFRKEIPNHLNIAQYKLTEPLPTLAASKTDIATAMPIVIPDSLPRRGDDLLDDPTPFVYRNRFYVITRKWESAILKVRAFSSDFNHCESYNLDLGKATAGLFLSVNSLVEIEGKLYLISGVYNGPPIDRRFFSYIDAIEVDESLTQTGRSITLSRTGEYDGNVACARYHEGILFVGYDVLSIVRQSEHKGMIKAFDTSNGFMELGSVQINEGPMVDNHFTFEVLGRKLYVFYQTPDEKLRCKVILWDNGARG